MAVLQNIRVKFGVLISVIIALALLSFIIDPSTIESAMNSMSSKYDVGNIDGRKISYSDFSEDVDRFTNINQIVTGSSVQSEEVQTQIRDAAWQDLIYKYLFVKNAKDAGINVGKDELVSLTTEENASPLISQNPFFMNQDGKFDRERFLSFIDDLDADQSGSTRLYWDFLQNSIYNQQIQYKYSSLFANGDCLNTVDLENALAENNTLIDVDYVTIPYESYLADSASRVTTGEAKKYYKSHKNFFKQPAGRDMEYVVYEVVPSDNDIIEMNNKFEALYDEFATTDNLKAFLIKNSEAAYSEYWYKAGELNVVSPEIEAYVASKPKAASSILRDGDKFMAARVMNTSMVSDSVYVKHILLSGSGAKNLADSLCNAIKKGSDFSTNAAQFSIDRGSAVDGEMGSVGWLTQTYMIPGFESTITADINKPYVIKTQYGTHVVVVTKKTKPVQKSQVAIFQKTTLPSKETFNGFYSQASRFATIANGTYDGYKAAVDSTGVYSYKLEAVDEATSTYGSIENAKEVTRWIFDNKAGKASNVLTVNNKYFFVAAVKGVHKEGYATFSEASPVIEQLLSQQKMAKLAEKDIASKIEGLSSLEQIAKAFDTDVMSKNGLSFSTMNLYETDPGLVGAAYSQPVGQIGKPVAGTMAAYVIKVTNREEGNFFTEEDAQKAADRKAQYGVQMIIPTMMDDADVKDNRARFF